MYAWTEINASGKTVKRGTEVTAKSLGVDSDEWEQLLEARSVRKQPFPDIPEGYSDSPNNWRIAREKAMLDELDKLDDEEELEPDSLQFEEDKPEDTKTEDE